MKRSARWKRLSVAAVALLVAYLLFWPVDLDPEAWTPPAPPALEGPYQQNTLLRTTERIGKGAGHAPEDVAIDAQGRVYGSFADGRILRFGADGSGPEIFADTGGRPAGLRFDAAGNLVVCDCDKGLLSIGPDGTVRVLSTEADGLRFGLADDLDIAADGTIYFTDASWKYHF